MARVSIEERAAVGAKKLAHLMGWSRVETIGSLYFLWHDSQELEQTTCSKDDVLLWMETTEHADKLIEGMIDCGYLRVIGPDEYEIVGNGKHIENLKQRRVAASEGGKRSGETRGAKVIKLPVPNIEANASTDTSIKIEANASTETKRTVEPSSLQFSAVQFSAEEEEKKEKAAFDFDACWKEMPEGIKQRAKKSFEEYIRTEAKYRDLMKAIGNYKAECEIKKRFLMHLSSFIGSDRTTHPWLEYIDKPLPEVSGTIDWEKLQ